MAKTKNNMTMEQLSQLVEDPKTDHYLFFEQFMDELYSFDNKKYFKTLKKIGEFVDKNRID